MSINLAISKRNTYPETCLVIRQYRIEWLIHYMETKKGIERIKAVQQYQEKANEYNNIVGFKCYDVNYDPLNAPKAEPVASDSVLSFLKPKQK